MNRGEPCLSYENEGNCANRGGGAPDWGRIELSAVPQDAITVAQGERFGAFRAPLTIAAIDSTGAAHRATIVLSTSPNAVGQLRVPVPSEPKAIVLDPDVELLARLRVVRQ
jgi:hypothetical protein